MWKCGNVTPHVKPRETRQAVTGSAYVEIRDGHFYLFTFIFYL